MRIVIGAFVTPMYASANLFMVLADEKHVSGMIDEMKAELSDLTNRDWNVTIAKNIEYNDTTKWHDAINRFQEMSAKRSANPEIELIRVRT